MIKLGGTTVKPAGLSAAYVGAERVYKAGGLPSGYTAVPYIHFDGACYFNSLIVVNTYDVEIETKCAFSGQTGTPKCAWGYMGSTASLPRWLLAAYTTGYLINANTTAMTGTLDSDFHIFKALAGEDENSTFWESYIDGTRMQRVSPLANPTSWENNTLPIYVGTRNNNGTAGSNNFFTGDMTYHKVTKGGVVVQALLSCRDSNDTLGFYDFSTGHFFTNEGPGSFTTTTA